MSIDLNIITNASHDDRNWNIADVPAKLWTQFVKRAEELMPEHGESAWSAFLCNAIASVCDGNQHTFIMTDIPIEAKAALDSACRQAECREDQIIAQLYKSAMLGKFHLLKIRDEDQLEDTHTITVIGLPDAAWQGWDKVGRQAGMDAYKILGHIFQAAMDGGLKFQSGVMPNVQSATSARNQAAPGVERGQRAASASTQRRSDQPAGRRTNFAAVNKSKP